MHGSKRSWEQLGAASGLLATLLFVIAFIVFLGASPGGDPGLPNIKHAETAPTFLADHLTALRVAGLLSSLGLVLFLWFLASLWTTLRGAEDEGRGATAALVGGTAGTVLILAGFSLQATAALATSPAVAADVATLYVAASLLIALGGGVMSLFFFGVAKVVLGTGALPRWLGVLAFIAALLAVCGLMTPFFEANILNAATGALGRWASTIAFVVWLGLASATMTLRQRQMTRGQTVAPVGAGAAEAGPAS